jgi:hypothetical protein
MAEDLRAILAILPLTGEEEDSFWNFTPSFRAQFKGDQNVRLFAFPGILGSCIYTIGRTDRQVGGGGKRYYLAFGLIPVAVSDN